MPTHHALLDGETMLSEMLAGPNVQTVMARDGVIRADVEALMCMIELRLSGGRFEPDRANRRVWAGMAFAD